MSDKIDYERKDYAVLAKEFGCHLRVGRYGVVFLPRDPGGNIYRLVSVIPLWGWVTDPKEVERVIRERGMEL